MSGPLRPHLWPNLFEQTWRRRQAASEPSGIGLFAPRTAIWPLALLMLVGCTKQTPDQDLAYCRTEQAKLPHLDTDTKQLRFVDNCMVSQGWRAPEACIKYNFQGTWMCDYTKS